MERARRRLDKELLWDLVAWPVRLVMHALDVPLRFLQRVIGIGGMPYAFLIPNLLFFGTS